jgi:hypothetical protein
MVRYTAGYNTYTNIRMVSSTVGPYFTQAARTSREFKVRWIGRRNRTRTDFDTDFELETNLEPRFKLVLLGLLYSNKLTPCEAQT